MTTSPASAGPVRPAVDERQRQDLDAALRAAMRGEVQFDSATRAIFATDSSNYRHVPLGVVFPLDHDDVVGAMRVCAEHDVPVVARGTGTSLAGQACNVAVVIDTSRHMTRIVEIDPVARTARVEPGVVLDDLRRAAEEHGLTFGPDPATHAWCTIGGMIGNNACGSHALYAGKTVDNVEQLRVVLYGGESLEVGAYDEEGYGAAVARGGPEARILTGLRDIGRRYEALVHERFPAIPRRVSGYNLDEVLPGRDLHVARALVGSESTCVIVTEATLHLSESPKHRRLVVLGYPDIFEAADAVPSLLRHRLLALEGFDGMLADLMRAKQLNVEHLPLLPEGGGWLLAELGSDDPAEADHLAEAFIADLPGGVAWRRYDDRAEQARVWLVRESGLGAAARKVDGRHNHEGWEDAAVAPEHLGTYLRAITGLWKEFRYFGVWYGHFGQGCVHTRNDFDFTSPEGVAAFRRYIERATDLVVSLGGSISGEHGDGQARGEMLERMYGPELIGAFREFKALFDPKGRMNPGMLVDAYPIDTDLRYGPGYRHGTLGRSTFTFGVDGRSLQQAAERCVGVGKCRRDDAGTMCPSYRVTRDERHSTRGRAKLLVEMSQGETTPFTWRNRDVRDALDLCLSCKGCATDCPTHVDMASYKSEYLHHYYARRLRPRIMYALGMLPIASRAVARIPWLPNAVLGAPVVGRVAMKVAGLTTARPAPRFANPPFRRTRTAKDRRDNQHATVVVWPDSFSDAFRPGPVEDLVAVLEATGERVAVPSKWACCGRPLYDAGMLDLARRLLRRLLDVLEPWTSQGIPVIVLEPSCLAAFRDELPALLPGDPRSKVVASLARSPAEHLVASAAFASLAEAERRDGGMAVPGRTVVHPHCHGRAIGVPQADRDLLALIGSSPEVLDAGCCGLAGSFGFRAEHEHLSRRIGEDQWLPKVREALGDDPDAALVIDGYGCEMQLHHLSDLESTTLITLVRRALGC